MDKETKNKRDKETKNKMDKETKKKKDKETKKKKDKEAKKKKEDMEMNEMVNSIIVHRNRRKIHKKKSKNKAFSRKTFIAKF